MVAPDETTYEFLRGRPHAPGADWDAAVAAWDRLRTDEGAEFDTEVYIDAATLSPFVTWGTNPGQGVPLSESVPDPELMLDDAERQSAEKALAYGWNWHGHARHPGGHGVRGLVHQRPHRRSARGGRHTAWPKGRRRRANAGCARFNAGARKPNPKGSVRSSPLRERSGDRPAARCVSA